MKTRLGDSYFNVLLAWRGFGVGGGGGGGGGAKKEKGANRNGFHLSVYLPAEQRLTSSLHTTAQEKHSLIFVCLFVVVVVFNAPM